ncbi:MAG TPA: MATE family efflux transporter [Candidatus Margulisiibacteriota bacterium]|nr:MATE family efflux transporter [Candidatus Margulisiibacteriota bacterium]
MTAKVEVLGSTRVHRLPGGVAEVALLASPAVLQTLSDTVMQVVDSAIVGRLGVTELGAVGFGGIWVWTMLVAFVGAATGVQTFVSHAFGAGERKQCGPWVWQALYALLPAAVLWVVAIELAFGPLIRLLGPSAELQALATSYAHGRLCGAPAVVAAVTLTSFFRGLGDTRTPLMATVLANVLNALACYGLVFGRFGLPALGVAGAGIATAISNWTYTGIMLVALLRPRMVTEYATRPTPADPSAMWRYARTSVPVGGQWVLDMISFALFSTIIARMGDTQMAASQAMIQLLSLSFMQAFGISIACGALVGRYVGARDLPSAERAHHSAMKLGMALATAVAVLFLAVPDALLGIFTSDPEVIMLGRPLLALGALFQLLDAVGIIAGGSLRGAGDTRFPFVMQATLAWCVRLPLVYCFAVVLARGVVGAWFGELLYVAVLGSAWLLRFRSGVWRTIRI